MHLVPTMSKILSTTACVRSPHHITSPTDIDGSATLDNPLCVPPAPAGGTYVVLFFVLGAVLGDSFCFRFYLAYAM